MRDPSEGLLPDGTINTGVARTKIPNPYLPLLDDLTSAVPPDVWVYVYGSVATGMAGWAFPTWTSSRSASTHPTANG